MTATQNPEPILSAEAAIAALSSEDNQIRYYAAWWLGKHQVQASCAALCEALEVQCAAARYLYLLTQQPQYIERIVRNLNHDNMYLRWAAVFDLGAVGHRQAVDAIMSAQVPNSLKLLNLKRILEGILAQQSNKETSQLLFKAIDDLLIQL